MQIAFNIQKYTGKTRGVGTVASLTPSGQPSIRLSDINGTPIAEASLHDVCSYLASLNAPIGTRLTVVSPEGELMAEVKS